jgi:predicted DNA-binding transcriptional regulator YafY
MGSAGLHDSGADRDKKFVNLLKVLTKVLTGQTVTRQELARELGVDKVSISRYVRDLNRAGYPIRYDRDRGSYVLNGKASLYRMDLDGEERIAWEMARRFLGVMGSCYQDAFDRIGRRCLVDRPFARNRDGAVFDIPSETTDAEHLGRLMKSLSHACAENQRVLLEYSSLYADETTQREVDPYHLFFTPDGFWNLRGFCHLRQNWRVFALDRILTCRLLDRHFLPCEEDLNYAQRFGAYMDGPTEEVIVRFSPCIRPYIERRQWHPSQQNRVLDDGSLEVHFNITGLEGMQHWLLRWIPHVERIEPKKVRQSLTEILAEQLNRL